MKSEEKKPRPGRYAICLVIVVIELTILVLTGIDRLNGRPDIAYTSDEKMRLSGQIYNTQDFEFDKIFVGSKEEYDRILANRKTVLDYSEVE